MAEARQKEIKLNITVVATKTFMAGLDPADVAMLPGVRELPIDVNFQDSIGEAEWCVSLRLAEC